MQFHNLSLQQEPVHDENPVSSVLVASGESKSLSEKDNPLKHSINLKSGYTKKGSNLSGGNSCVQRLFQREVGGRLNQHENAWLAHSFLPTGPGKTIQRINYKIFCGSHSYDGTEFYCCGQGEFKKFEKCPIHSN